MLASVYRIIEATLDLDHTLSDEERERIQTVCRRPRSSKVTIEEQMPSKMMTLQQVADALQVSRCTVWRLKRAGKLKPVLIDGISRFRQADIRKIVEPDGVQAK